MSDVELMYLIKIASGTDGAEVWRALFAEMLQNAKQKALREASQVVEP